ncbi:uncharacterized protein LOC117250372 isoform X2 [Epinephelus lanceolatus]
MIPVHLLSCSLPVSVTMKTIYAYSCLLFALSFVEMKPLSITGHVGRNVTIECSDWDSVTDVKYNVKYFCDSPCTEDKHIIVKAESGKTEYKNRIEVSNTADGLFVTFSNLQESDSKTYYCGVERFGPDLYIKVNLKVTKAESSSPKTTPKKVTAGPTLSFTVTDDSITSSYSSDNMTDMSTSHTTLNTMLPTAPATGGAGYVPYLTAGVASIITIVMVVLILARKMMKKQQAVSTPPEDTVERAGPDQVYQSLHQFTMDEDKVYSTLTPFKSEQHCTQLCHNVD